jgi:hypothetical protein
MRTQRGDLLMNRDPALKVEESGAGVLIIFFNTTTYLGNPDLLGRETCEIYLRVSDGPGETEVSRLGAPRLV